VSTDETDRLLSALDVPRLAEEVEARHTNAVDRSVTRYQRQKAGLEPYDALDACKAAQEAWERRHATEAQKAA
jgi:hypothetical protein